MNVTLIELLQMLKDDAVALPMIDILPPERNQDPLLTVAYINRTAVFKQDKMIGSLDDEKTRGLIWVRDKIKDANITMKPQEAKGYISKTLIRENTKLVPKIEDGQWKITVKAVTESAVVLNESNLKLQIPKNTKILEKMLKKRLKNR